jgi:hypothetical protein
MPRQSVSLALTVTQSLSHPGWVRAVLRKQWWHVAVGTRSRKLVETGFWRGEMGERELVESALREVLRAYCDELYKL